MALFYQEEQKHAEQQPQQGHAYYYPAPSAGSPINNVCRTSPATAVAAMSVIPSSTTSFVQPQQQQQRAATATAAAHYSSNDISWLLDLPPAPWVDHTSTAPTTTATTTTAHTKTPVQSSIVLTKDTPAPYFVSSASSSPVEGAFSYTTTAADTRNDMDGMVPQVSQQQQQPLTGSNPAPFQYSMQPNFLLQQQQQQQQQQQHQQQHQQQQSALSHPHVTAARSTNNDLMDWYPTSAAELYASPEEQQQQLPTQTPTSSIGKMDDFNTTYQECLRLMNGQDTFYEPNKATATTAYYSSQAQQQHHHHQQQQQQQQQHTAFSSIEHHQPVVTSSLSEPLVPHTTAPTTPPPPTMRKRIKSLGWIEADRTMSVPPTPQQQLNAASNDMLLYQSHHQRYPLQYNPKAPGVDWHLVQEDPDAMPRPQKPRYPGDEYSPQWVRYSGHLKEGYCDSCVPGKWLQLKNSAYWYHKQFFHGISSVSGKQFLEPIKRRMGAHDTVEGLCHQCGKYVPVCNGKRKNSVLWYRHAHKCHVYDKPTKSQPSTVPPALLPANGKYQHQQMPPF